MAPTLPYLWNARAFSYVDPKTKRFVSGREVRDAADRALRAASDRMGGLARQLRERKITLAEWELRMMQEIRTAHLYSAAMAKGGFEQMGAADWGRAGREIRTQYEFLRKRAEKIASGEQRLDGTLESRARTYSNAARATYHEVERREMELRGFDEESNVRNKRDSCDGCKRETGRGWVKLGKLVKIGQRDCMTSCACYLAYRMSATGEERFP